MKRALAFILALIGTLCLLTACTAKYHEKDLIGKTSAEITAEYGPFDCILMPADADGLYKNCRCGYTIKEAQKGFFGRTEEVLFFISFDENGIAVSCGEGYRPGG